MSAVSICNQALGQLGANLISRVGEEGTEGQLCQAYYEPILRAVLGEHDWTFAISKFRLTPVNGAPVSEYGQKFQIPAQIIKILSVRQDQDPEAYQVNTLRWERIGDFIESDAGVIYVRAVKYFTDDTKYHPMFTQAFVYRLASEMAVPLTNSRPMKESYYALYKERLEEAIAADNLQGRTKVMRSTKLTAVRRRGYGTTRI